MKGRGRWVSDEERYGLTGRQVRRVRGTPVCDLCERSWDEVAHAEWKREDNIDHCHDCGKVRGSLCFRCNYHIVGALEQGKFVKTRLYRRAEAYIMGGGAGRLMGKRGFGCVCPQRVLVERLRQKPKEPRGREEAGAQVSVRSAQSEREGKPIRSTGHALIPRRGADLNGEGGRPVAPSGVAGNGSGMPGRAGSDGGGEGFARVRRVTQFPAGQELMCRLADAGKRDCTVAVRSDPTRDNPRAVAVFVWDAEGGCWERVGWLLEPPASADGLVGQIRRSVKNPKNPGLLVTWPPIEQTRSSVAAAGDVPNRSGGRSIGGL